MNRFQSFVCRQTYLNNVRCVSNKYPAICLENLDFHLMKFTKEKKTRQTNNTYSLW